MFKRPIEGKKAKTISCKNVHLEESVSELSYRKPDVKGVSPAEIVKKTSYAQVTDAYVEGALVKMKKPGSVNDDITLDKLFYIQGEKK